MTLLPIWPSPRDDQGAKACSFYVPEVPGEEDGDKIKMYIVPFSEGSVDDLLQFRRQVAQLFRAKMMMNDGARKLSFLRLLLVGNSLAQFEGLYTTPDAELIADHANEAAAAAQDLLNLDEAVNNAYSRWLDLRLPDNSGRTIKKELRKMMKPQSMDIAMYLSRMSEINSLIEACPDGQVSYTEAELIEIIEDNIPQSWTHALRTKADYHDIAWTGLMAYLKLLETTDGHVAQRRRGNSPSRLRRGGRGRRNDRRRGYRPPQRGNGGGGGGTHGGGRPGGGNDPGGGGGRGGAPGRNNDQGGRGGRGPPFVRRSQRARTAWCPHCRTTNHDGATCPQRIEYLRSSQQGHEAHQLDHDVEEVHFLDIEESTVGGEEMITDDDRDSVGDDQMPHHELNMMYADIDFASYTSSVTSMDSFRDNDDLTIEPIWVYDDDETARTGPTTVCDDADDGYWSCALMDDEDDDAMTADTRGGGEATFDARNVPPSFVYVEPMITDGTFARAHANHQDLIAYGFGLGDEVNVLTRSLQSKADGEDGTPSAVIQIRLPNDPTKRLYGLLDSGSSLSLALASSTPPDTEWTEQTATLIRTKTGHFESGAVSELTILLPEFSSHREVKFEFHRDDTKLSPGAPVYDFILGRDFLAHTGLMMDWSQRMYVWDDLEVPMSTSRRPRTVPEAYVQASSHRPATIEHAPMDQAKFVMTKDDVYEHIPDHLTPEQGEQLAAVLQKYMTSFQGGIGLLPGAPLDLTVATPEKPPIHLRPYNVPHSLQERARAEVDRMVEFGILRPIFRSRWAAPSMAMVKSNGNVRIVTDFRALNERLVRHPYPMPKLANLFQRMEGFDYISALDLSLGFYHVGLSEQAQEMCTTVFPWGKYAYMRLPMGISIAPDVFQHRMDELLGDLPYVLLFIDDILVWTKGTYDEHVKQLDNVLGRLHGANLQLSLPKCHFCTDKVRYLGFILSKDGIHADPKKIEAIQQLAVPKTRKNVRSFLGMCAFIRETIPKYSHMTAPLTALMSSKVPFRWTDDHTKVFRAVQAAVGKAIMLAFPNYDRPFEVFCDASDMQIGSLICQRETDRSPLRVLACVAKKLTPAQRKYTVGEKELFSVVETLRKHRHMLWGYPLVVWTDHKNLTFRSLQSDRVARWRLYVEEFAPQFKYYPGAMNAGADALSRLELTDNADDVEELHEVLTLADDEPCPIDYAAIGTAQQSELADPTARGLRPRTPHWMWKKATFGTTVLWVTKENKISVPPSLQENMVDWYHEMLSHPGEQRLAETLLMRFNWPGLRVQVKELCRRCDACQRFKGQRKQYGTIPLAFQPENPWETVAVDLIGPWTIPRPRTERKRRGVDLKAIDSGDVTAGPTLLCLTIMDLATRWIELVRIPSKDSDLVAMAFDREWLSRYPRPTRCVHDQGSEFIGEEFQEMLASYGIAASPTTVKNPTANAILERSHQVIANMLRTKDMETVDLNAVPNPLDGLLASAAFALRAAYHVSLRAAPAQLAFGRDMFFPVQHVANWHATHNRLLVRAQEDNRRENRGRIPHRYRVGDLVLIRRDRGNEVRPKLAKPTFGPFRVLAVHSNGTVTIDRRRYREVIHIRRLVPYYH